MIKIDSVNNPKISQILKLKDKKYRINNEQFIIEGYHLIEEAIKHQVLKYIISTKESDFKQYNVDGYLVNEAIMKKLTETINSQSIIGIVDYKFIPIDYQKSKLLIALENINDPGNLGTIIRTSAAFNVDGIIKNKESCEVYNPKTIRSTQGSIFKIGIEEVDLIKKIQELKFQGFKVYITSLATDITLDNVQIGDKVIIVFGNEANGVSKEMLKLADVTFKIEMSSLVESLNVSTAHAICTYEISQKMR